ncbi:MAG: hypothetical protein Q8Q52_01320 [Acidimicrobiia bacterium]|nr:hypothetical protein [Acidimicrobiia bacterium]
MEKGIVYVLKPDDHQAGVAGDSLKLTNHRQATYLLQFGAVTGDAVLTVKSGATAGTETTAETFYTRLADADQGSADADQYGAEAAGVTTLTLTAATYDNRILVVEVIGAELTADQEWITLAFSGAASALNVAVVAILSEPRYSATDQPTAIA